MRSPRQQLLQARHLSPLPCLLHLDAGKEKRLDPATLAGQDRFHGPVESLLLRVFSHYQGGQILQSGQL